MATFELVIKNDTSEVFDIEAYQAHEIIATGVRGMIHLDDSILNRLFDTTRYVSINENRRGKSTQECWGVHVKSFQSIFGDLKEYITQSKAPLMPDVKPPKLENLNDMFKQLVSHYERFHPSERPVMGADSTDTTNRVESQLKQLIFDMYEHEHAVTPAPPKGLHDCKGTYVGDLIHNYNYSQPKHSLQDYVNTGWTREQLLKEKMFIVAPQPPCAAPAAAPVTMVEQKELAISQLLLDLKDNNLPESVRILVELLVNLKSE